MMEYKGYNAAIEYDDSARAFHGRVLGIRDVVNFYGDNVDDLEKDFRVSVDDYLEFCEELGREPQRPFSGKFVIRIDPGLHQQVYTLAHVSGVSMNEWVASSIASSVADSDYAQDVPDLFDPEEASA